MVLTLIHKLKINKSLDLSGIHLRFLKALKYIIADLITKICSIAKISTLTRKLENSTYCKNRSQGNQGKYMLLKTDLGGRGCQEIPGTLAYCRN